MIGHQSWFPSENATQNPMHRLMPQGGGSVDAYDA